MEIIFVGITINVITALILKFINIRYNRNQINERKNTISKYNLMDDKISYDKYRKVAHKTSVRNTPVRTYGDFWDFILPFLKKGSKKCIEDMLSHADCGDNNE